jgi:hypothetical protein
MAPPASVPTVRVCPSTIHPSTAVQNGSTVEMIAVRTEPSTARPRRKLTNATNVQNIAVSATMPQVYGMSDHCIVPRSARPPAPPTALSAPRTTSTTPAPSVR